LIKEGVPEEKIAVVKLGVDLKKFRPPDQKPKSATAQILFVGRAVDEKGINDLKKAIKGLKANLKIVKFGTLDYSAMPKIYQKADLLIFPSKKTKTWEEQYGMVLVEAMASALPIVAYDSGAIKEVVGEAGILVPENNLQQLALKVSTYC
jgi:glycosyltransferase involved in cell wall biosynthesis